MTGEKEIFSLCNSTAEDFSVVKSVVENFATVPNEDFLTCKEFLQVRSKSYVPFWNTWGSGDCVINTQEYYNSSTVAKNATLQNIKFYGWRI